MLHSRHVVVHEVANVVKLSVTLGTVTVNLQQLRENTWKLSQTQTS